MSPAGSVVVTLDRASYAISKPRTLLSCSYLARACFSPGLISGSYLDARGHSTRASSRRTVVLPPAIAHPLTALRRHAGAVRHPPHDAGSHVLCLIRALHPYVCKLGKGLPLSESSSAGLSPRRSRPSDALALSLPQTSTEEERGGTFAPCNSAKTFPISTPP